jgi:hypothetical protein
MEAFANIPESQKAELIRHMEDQQMRDSLRYSVVRTWLRRRH